MMSEMDDLRRDIVGAARQMNALGINQGTSGNVSARVRDGFLITPTGIPYDDLTGKQIVQMTSDGQIKGSILPSSEWQMHQDIYNARDDAAAIVHTHSAYATAISCIGGDIPAFHYMIAVAGGNSLRCARYATFGTKRLSDNAIEALKGRRACLLANHGMICFGKDLKAALNLAVEVETLCKQYVIARQLGTPNILDDDEMDIVLEKFSTYGQQTKS